VAADPLALDKVVDAVLECMCSALTATAEVVEGQPGCPCLECKYPGAATPWTCEAEANAAGECAAGQLAVRVNRLYPSTTFPSQDLTADACAPSTIVAEVSVLLLRCMPVVSDQETDCLPTCAQNAAAAKILHVDMVTMIRAATCCVPFQGITGTRRKRRVAVSSHRAVGPLERCVGSELILLIDIGSQCCDDDLPTPDPSV
jgi:hypothetical protein